MQSIDSIETESYETSKDLVSEKEDIKCNNIIKRYMMINFDNVTNKKVEEQNPNWPEIADHLYRIFIFRDTELGKTNLLFNLRSQNQILFIPI